MSDQSLREQLDDAIIDLIICGLPKDCAWVDGKLISPIRKRTLVENRRKQYDQAKKALLALIRTDLLEHMPEKPSNQLIQASLQNGKTQQAASYNGFRIAVTKVKAIINQRLGSE